MATLLEMVRDEVQAYTTKGMTSKAFALLDDEHQIYAVNTIGYPIRKRPANVMVMARVVDEMVIIEEDRTDRPLVEALLARGIPRQQIVLAYIGESAPATTTP
jgi:hypothetical protein